MIGTPEQQVGPTQHVPVASNRTPITAALASAPLANRQAIKIRLVSWNLGDSVPKGDLATLLGEVSPYHPPDHLITSLPVFAETDGEGHPYHLIVVAAQECPSASGVPRGLAAGVTKGVIGGLKEKEKLKEREKAKEAKELEKAEKDWVSQMERIHGTGTTDSSVAATPVQETSPTSFTFPPKPLPKDDTQGGVSTGAVAATSSNSAIPPSVPGQGNENSVTDQTPGALGDEPTSTPGGLTSGISMTRTPHHGHHTGHVSSGAKGWSDLLEDYLCRGIKFDPKARPRRSGSISFRQGSTSGSLPSTPLQGPAHNVFAKSGANSSPSSTPSRAADTASVHRTADRSQTPISGSSLQAEPRASDALAASIEQTTNTLRQPIPIPVNGLVPPPSVLKDGNSMESRHSAGKRAPPSPTFSFELQTPTPLSEAPPTLNDSPSRALEAESNSQRDHIIYRHITSSPLSFTSGATSHADLLESSMTDATESDVPTFAEKSRQTSCDSLRSHRRVEDDAEPSGVKRFDSANAKEASNLTASQSAGYFTAQPGHFKDKRLAPLQIPTAGHLSNGAKASPAGGLTVQNTGGSTCSSAKSTSGPYHFLVKERLLGLYLAIFVHRDCKDWVKGYDHDYVPAGLAGGRIGNKGGIGMSLNMAGHRFLFVNSHLAAHAHKVEARIANVAKIKSELHLDCFLPESDPRARAEDITDRYDTVFWMGDLNFRLDISRLHADWLVSRKEYAQALEFDQLRNAMLRGEVFDGFSEAPIDFAPTFKYDVWRSAKRTRSMVKKAEAKSREKEREAKKEGECIMEVDEECETDNGYTDDQSSMLGADRRTSIDTSAGLSTIAGTISDGDSISSERPVTVTQPHRPVAAVAKTTAIKAKHRFMKFIKAATPPVNIPMSHSSSRSSSIGKSASPSMFSVFSPPSATGAAPDVTTHTYPSQLLEDRRQSIDSTLAESFATGTSASNRPGLTRQISTKLKRRFSTSQSNQDVNDDDSSSSSEEDIRQGVYDSSSKQRVPSWCDRVLWKTIIEEDKSVTSPTSGGPVSPESKISRMSHNLAARLHLTKDLPVTDLPLQDATLGPAPMLSPIVKDQPTTLQQLVPATVAVGAASASSIATALDRHTRDSSRPAYPRSNPGSSDSSPARSLFEMDSATRRRLPERLKHRSISGALLKSTTSTTATSHEHGHWNSGTNTHTHDHKGEHQFLRSRTMMELPRADTLHHLFSGDGVETSIANAKKWFSHLVRPRSEIEDTPAPRSPSPELEPEPAPEPPKRKGEVVCLKYDTLDDAAMRRLEGRSDHRPIIFSAAVYI